MNVLVAACPPESLAPVLRRLRENGVCPIVAPGEAEAARLLATFTPDLAIVGTDSPALLSRLERRGVPVIVAGGEEELQSAGELRMLAAALLSPVRTRPSLRLVLPEPDDSPTDDPDVLLFGPLRLDRVARLAFLDGDRVDLPPKELAILEYLALRQGEPVPAPNLVHHVWPEDVPATVEDVHRHVYRLRKRLDDHRRRPPLIANRRGFGYVLGLPRTEPGRVEARSG